MTRDEIIALVLKEEGGYVDNPADPGGATNFGITQRYLDGARLHDPTLPSSVRDLTITQASALYAADQWHAVQGDALPPDVAAVAFDGAINEGPGTVVKLLQQALRVPVDGVIGPATIAAARTNPKAAQLLAAQRGSHYAKIVLAHPGEVVFLDGWMNRIFTIFAAVA
jgi:lysozyme family protein